MAGTKVSSHVIADNIALGGNPTTTTQSAGNNTTRIATTAFVTGAIADLSDSAPSTLNTLNELAAALGDDANFSATVTNSIAAKLPLAGGTMSGALNMGSQNITNIGRLSTADGIADTGSAGSSTVFNESGSTADFRIESTSNANAFFLDGGLDRIGIFQASPAAELHVNGNILLNNANEIRQKDTGGAVRTVLRINSSNDLEYGYSGSGAVKIMGGGSYAEKIRIHTNGSVGINQTQPSSTYALDVNGQIRSTGNSPAFNLRDDDSSNQHYQIGSYGGVFAVRNVTGSSYPLQISGNKVGINEGSPDKHLHIKDSGNVGIAIESTDNAQNLDIDFYNNSGSAAGRIRYAEGPGAFGFAPNVSADDALYINYTGLIGIGTSSPQTQLHVAATNNSAGDLYTAVGAGNVPSLTIQNAGTTDNNNAAIFFRNDAGMFASVGARFVSHSTDETELRLATTDSSSTTRERVVIKGDGSVGIGTMTPQKAFEVETDASSVVSVGVSQMSANNYAGIHFGYKENNSYYRKSAIVFKRTDLSSNNAQGKVHILNGPLSGNGSATLSDRKLTIMENGNTEVPFIRAGAWSGDAMHTEGTDAIELGVSGGLGYVHGYDRTNSHYIELAYDGVAHRFSTSGGYPNVHIDSNGNMAINTGAAAGTSATTQNSLMDAVAHTGTVLSNNGPVVMGRADGSNSGETGAQYYDSAEPRCIRNFFTYAGPSSNAYTSPYIHMKTNLWAGGSLHGNTEFTMSCFTFYDYYGYGTNYSCYGTSGWHNWSGSYYNLMLRNYGNWDIAYNPYTSSDGYVVIVARVPNAYSQFSVDWAQWGGYAWRERKITNVAQHNASTGKY